MRFTLLLSFCLFFSYNKNLSAQTRKVIIEDITGSWCGFCPDGIATLSRLNENFDNIICVATHVGDPMENSASAEIGDVYSGGGVNVLMLDRYLCNGEQFVQLTSQYEPAALHLSERLAMPAQVGITMNEISYNPTTRQLSVTVNAHFENNLPNYNDLRLNLWIVEDSVSGTLNSYNQVNFYNTYAQHPYFGAGNPISNFIHRHVLRAALGTAWGAENSISTSNVQGQTFSRTFTTVLEANWQLSRLSLVGLVQNYHTQASQREILNAEQIDLSDALQAPPISTNANSPNAAMPQDDIFAVYPNPIKANNPITINYTLGKPQNVRIAMYDVQGKQIKVLLNEKQAMGNYNITDILGTQVTEGVYTLIFETAQNKIARQIIVGQ